MSCFCWLFLFFSFFVVVPLELSLWAYAVCSTPLLLVLCSWVVVGVARSWGVGDGRWVTELGLRVGVVSVGVWVRGVVVPGAYLVFWLWLGELGVGGGKVGCVCEGAFVGLGEWRGGCSFCIGSLIGEEDLCKVFDLVHAEHYASASGLAILSSRLG